MAGNGPRRAPGARPGGAPARWPIGAPGRLWLAWWCVLALAACGGRPPDPVPVPPDRTAEFEGTCRAIWAQELTVDPDMPRVIEPEALVECVRRCRAGETGDQILASVRASEEWAWVQAEKKRRAELPKGRPGVVRMERHAAGDAAGSFNALGTSLFWAVWGHQHDRARLEQNLAEIQRAGAFDFVRALGVVGPAGGWGDRVASAADAWHLQAVAEFTDLAYDKYGLRVQWTIFGGVDSTPDAASRERLVDRFAEMSAGREHKIFAFEVANEAWQNGFGGSAGTEELRRLGRRLNDRTVVPVALTSPDAGGHCATYAGSGADFATMHYERNRPGGPWHAVRQPWGYPGEYEAGCVGQLPAAVTSNEPIGPQSSVAEDADPLRMVMSYATALVSQNAAYVYHTAAGIRGGGAADLARGRAANVWEVPNWAATVAAFRAARGYLPQGLANWQRHNAQWASAPITGYARYVDDRTLARAYAATEGGQVLQLLLGVARPVTGVAARPMALDVLNPLTGDVVQRLELAGGQAFTVGGMEAFILKGVFR